MKCILFSLIITFFLFATAGIAQTGIRAIVTDQSGIPLSGATVMILQPKDSTLITFGRTTESGRFDMKFNSQTDYLLRITYVGLKHFNQLISAESQFTDLDTIVLYAGENMLNGVTISSERSPVTIKNDTIEYNANSFKVQPNAIVEDLLKKMPGIEVDQDGTVKAQGEKVRKVTVDGKEFFGNDPKIATKNLPANAIDKVQVFDRKSDQAQFTGIDDGQREKTINLSLKEDKKNQGFGTITAGGGYDRRFNAKGNYNQFSKERQFTALAMGNNINQQGFSIDDYLNFNGGMQRMVGGGGVRIEITGGEDSEIPLDFGGRTNGYLNSWAGGLNFNNEFINKAELNGSYFYNRASQDIAKSSDQRSSFQTSNLKTDQNTDQNTLNETHRISLTLNKEFDKSNALKWTNKGSYRMNSNSIKSKSASSSDNGMADNYQVKNESDRNSSSRGNGLRLNSELLFKHKFAKKGRTVSATANTSIDAGQKKGFLNTINKFYQDNPDEPTIDTIRQNNSETNDQLNVGAKVSYTEPLGKKKYFEFNYAWQQNNNALERNVYDRIADSNGEIFNPLLSNNYENKFTYQRAGMNFRWNEKKWNSALGVSFQDSKLDGKLLLTNVDINKRFRNLLPNARFQYSFNNSRSLDFNYDTDVNAPDVRQLTPVADNSDPLNIILGNPDLRTEFNHAFSINFRDFNQLNFSNLMAFAELTYTRDKIVQSQSIDDQFIRTYKPVNVRNELNIDGNISKGFRIKAINTRFSISSNINYNRGLSLINDIENKTAQTQSRNTLRADYTMGEKLDVSASGMLTFNFTKYSLNKELDQFYTNQKYVAEADYKFSDKLRWNTSFNYFIYSFQNSNYNQKIPLLNSSLSYFFLKGSRGELKLSAVDILNKNIIINRIAQGNFVQDERITSLGRYVLLSFTYSLRGMSAQPHGTFRVIENN